MCIKSMNLQPLENSFLLPRNEGKLKSFESCDDCRAWSHDAELRTRHLAHWMKSDMPFCVLPVCTLLGVLRTMSRRSRGRITPRCHPDCKSKVVLQSLCSSCNAIKECLRSKETFEQYFVEEELETSHWPCETCLEVLKTVKMMWRIIAEKVFHIKMPHNDTLTGCRLCSSDSIRTVAKSWQREIEQQALYVESKSHPSCCSSKSRLSNPIKKCVHYADNDVKLSQKCSKYSICSTCSHKSNYSHKLHSSTTRCKRVSVRADTADADCNCSFADEELATCRTNFECLQINCNSHREEINRLKKENSSLKLQLRNVCKNCKWKTALYCPIIDKIDPDSIILAPKPFECCMDEARESPSAKDIDSEMIITLRNCKNESFRHVSLLQILHKTNDPCEKDIQHGRSCCVKEDPINILTKVQNALGAIVNRELCIATCSEKKCERKSEIEATFQKVMQSKSAPSCNSLPSCYHSGTSELITLF